MARKRILLVEDEPELNRAIKIRLEAAGFEIISAMDGEEGLEMARKEKPDLIVLDLILPNMSGFDVCHKLKIDKEYKDIPIIMLTAKFQPNDIRFGIAMGADAYITKPYESQELFTKIGELLKDRP
jgi:DNA-binding response OmpR family regulator